MDEDGPHIEVDDNSVTVGGHTAQIPETATLSEMIAAWRIPVTAKQATALRNHLSDLSTAVDDDPDLISSLALGPMFILLGQLEAQVVAAREEITALQERVAQNTGARLDK